MKVPNINNKVKAILTNLVRLFHQLQRDDVIFLPLVTYLHKTSRTHLNKGNCFCEWTEEQLLNAAKCRRTIVC